MNRTELINRIIERLYDKSDHADLTKILEEELPDFQRIDEERFKRIYASKVCDIGLHIKECNSTLQPALKPLPKEMPKDLTRFAMGHDVYEVWDKIISEYGTPEPKPELPSVEVLAKEIKEIPLIPGSSFINIAQYLHDKYSLHTREWWQGDIKGMKVIHTQCGDEKIELSGKIFVEATSNLVFDVNKCTPYTPLSAQDIIKKHNLSDEEVRAIREGK